MKLSICLLLVAISAAPLFADFAYPVLTPAQKAAQSEYVIVGKIIDIEKEPLLAAPYPYAEGTIEYKMVTVKIADRLFGAGGVTQVRVGFAPMNLGPRRGQIALQGLKTEVGTEACYFLLPHSSGDFFVPVPWGAPLDSNAKNFKEQIAEVQKVTSVLSDPTKALKLKESSERTFAARTLIGRYRSAPAMAGKGVLKQEDIAAEESKLILSALAEMPWLADEKSPGRATMWSLLNPSAKEGFTFPPASKGEAANKAMDDATLKWLKDQRDTYRIKRFVVERKK